MAKIAMTINISAKVVPFKSRRLLLFIMLFTYCPLAPSRGCPQSNASTAFASQTLQDLASPRRV